MIQSILVVGPFLRYPFFVKYYFLPIGQLNHVHGGPGNLAPGASNGSAGPLQVNGMWLNHSFAFFEVWCRKVSWAHICRLFIPDSLDAVWIENATRMCLLYTVGQVFLHNTMGQLFYDDSLHCSVLFVLNSSSGIHI